LVHLLQTFARQRPKAARLALALLFFAGAGAGVYGYALYQWRAAQRALQGGRAAEAHNRLKTCLVVWPRSVPVHLLAARADRLQSDFDGVAEHLNRCLKLQGGASVATQLEFLLMRAQTGEEEEVAQPLFDHVEAGHPESRLILETMARAYMQNLNLGRAYACLTRWIEAMPDDAKPYHWRGWVQERLDNPKDAMQDYLHALERDPNLYPVRLRVAELLLEDFKPLEALPHLERLAKEYPDNAEVQARLGHCKYLVGDSAAARPLLEAAVTQLPDDLPLLQNLAKVELQDGHPDMAEAWLRKALQADPSDTEALFTLHTVLQQQGRAKDATAVLDEYNRKSTMLRRVNKLLRDEAKRPSSDPDTLAELGELLLQVERESVGMHWLAQALQLDPGHKHTHQVLAEYYESKGNKEKAAEHRRWLTAPPPQPEARARS
jgi:tetratricopeptide (TPR) repeat protein